MRHCGRRPTMPRMYPHTSRKSRGFSSPRVRHARELGDRGELLKSTALERCGVDADTPCRAAAGERHTVAHRSVTVECARMITRLQPNGRQCRWRCICARQLHAAGLRRSQHGFRRRVDQLRAVFNDGSAFVDCTAGNVAAVATPASCQRVVKKRRRF